MTRYVEFDITGSGEGRRKRTIPGTSPPSYLTASIGYVTPDDEHHGRGPQIRRARAAGMRRARAERIKQNRAHKR